MLLLSRLWKKRRQRHQLRSWMLETQTALAKRVRTLAEQEQLEMENDFTLRFELMILLVSDQMVTLRRQGGDQAAERIQGLWTVTFEGFDASLRDQGVNDIRIGKRMHKLIGHGSGRRKAYVEALENNDLESLRDSIARNVLNGAQSDDTRIDPILAELSSLND
ncbi:MAG: hypothetical protein HQL54_00205 [Magnetococcales bacterium]|nr:hypothetical protein [Magnetococcales bacterium]